ncbi:peptide ABC transporter ATP-binding protein [Desulfobacter hydrogenophilus]|uniref:ABC transporter ATP-binding protein n=1 Tax=Desulfobacter hydrogenophilus TaxID=2291 RepID=A0A328FJK7_9BACT|nr:ABC transporter ATP-binding protein [Desulfobacter hydrogenophilus]NDY74059.1 ABC transporter ATP-binding protein [Desulfobacter hydrogenophilus]QBH13431.1 ABC transporter ATP-binding protein [Desulfobacter hydrogenophilus]RAM03682.1 peptide ABC transporter ATP-binding protein [Desulfobacter hydrogenophilus]
MNQKDGPPLLAVKHLGVAFQTDQGQVLAVDDVSFELESGQVLGIAGESGCGKSVTALSLMRLLPQPVSKITEGEILFKGQNLLDFSIGAMRKIRGKKISMIFQEPMTALNPVHTVGRQIAESYSLHFPDMGEKEKNTASLQMLAKVGIPDARQVMKKYPHQLSGGMRQRVMIGMALACEPDILIADEPTTALDVTVQAQIMDLIFQFRDTTGMAVILITHDLGLIAENCDRVVIMYAGTVSESASVTTLFHHPFHPYTKKLLQSIPSRAQTAKEPLPTIPGNVPVLSKMPVGCRFAKRCEHALPQCENQRPRMMSVSSGHFAACHLVYDCEKKLNFDK